MPENQSLPSHRRIRALLAILCSAVFVSAAVSVPNLPKVQSLDRRGLQPRLILWAWERPEDLRFIDTRTTGVAYLARTLRIANGRVTVLRRMQPLRLPVHASVIAVVRIEVAPGTDLPMLMSKLPEVSRSITALAVAHPSGVQIDYDARLSERPFYRGLLADVRRSLSPAVPLSITALASWCLGDRWIEDLPIDEAVPMLFEMGPEGPYIRNHLRSGGQLRGGLCGTSVGVATTEPIQVPPGYSRTYFFSRVAWTADLLAQARKGFPEVP